MSEIQSWSKESAHHDDDNQSGESSIANLEYFAADCEDKFRHLRLRCGMLCAIFNAQAGCCLLAERSKAWNDIVNTQGAHDEDLEAPTIKAPITVDYGINIRIVASALLNRNCWISDSPLHSVTIGERVVLGVGVHIYGTHPVVYEEGTCRQGPSVAGPVVIEDDVHIGSYAVIMPGVTVGRGAVIAASAVITRNVPAYVLVAGSPAHIVRKLRNGVAEAILEGDKKAGVGINARFEAKPSSTVSALQVVPSRDTGFIPSKLANKVEVLCDIFMLSLAVVFALSLVHSVLG
ncbi:putative acetyltransferase C18B11.09c [Pseudocercospora fuligena]|uniref:Putative acetyltransferase C18B11.09c n=1 Tax=Pseudocercospora fuligena TaxID=685502 RepID=A0A8H6RVT2_9PEZI|nr:putative acetyltransferase C18B11.09c [Pseudocercospora fuligena]